MVTLVEEERDVGKKATKKKVWTVSCDEDDAFVEEKAPVDMVNHPPHYTSHPSGVECVTIAEHMNFCRGNALKYLWRAGEKGDELEDLKKAAWYLAREIARVEKSRAR